MYPTWHQLQLQQHVGQQKAADDSKCLCKCRISSVDGSIVSTLFSHYVTTLSASSLCPAPSGKIAAPHKKPIAGFPGSSNKQEGILPANTPSGLYSAKGELNIAIHPAHQTYSQYLAANS